MEATGRMISSGTHAGSRGSAPIAPGIHRSKLIAAQIDQLRREAAAAGDPAPNLLRINAHQKLSPFLAHGLVTGLVRPPGRVEPESRPGGHTQTVAWDYTEHHRAGRETRTIDDHVLAGIPERLELFEIGTDLPARIRRNAYGS